MPPNANCPDWRRPASRPRSGYGVGFGGVDGRSDYGLDGVDPWRQGGHSWRVIRLFDAVQVGDVGFFGGFAGTGRAMVVAVTLGTAFVHARVPGSNTGESVRPVLMMPAGAGIGVGGSWWSYRSAYGCSVGALTTTAASFAQRKRNAPPSESDPASMVMGPQYQPIQLTDEASGGVPGVGALGSGVSMRCVVVMRSSESMALYA